MDIEIATLCIDKAWIDEKDKSLISYNLVDPDDVDHVLVTPRSSKLGKLLLKEIKEVELAAVENAKIEAVRAATGGRDHGEFVSHPYGSAGDDSGEVSVAPFVRGVVRLDGSGGGFWTGMNHG